MRCLHAYHGGLPLVIGNYRSTAHIFDDPAVCSPRMVILVVCSDGDALVDALHDRRRPLLSGHAAVHLLPLQFSIELLFDLGTAPLTLLHMVHYLSYLSFQYSTDAVRGEVLVASNDAMRERFLGAVLERLPGASQTMVHALMQQGLSMYNARRGPVAVSQVYNANHGSNLKK